MIVRIVSPGWETFTGSMGHRAMFKDGVSVEPLTFRQIARIGSSLKIVDVETGDQVGPSASIVAARFEDIDVQPNTQVQHEQKAIDDEVAREALDAENKARAAADDEALEAAKLKEAAAAEAAAEEAKNNPIFYSRAELEAIGANDGIQGLRDIATPLGVKGRSITEMVNEILTAQTKLTVV